MSPKVLSLFAIALIGSACQMAMPLDDEVLQDKAQLLTVNAPAPGSPTAGPRMALAEATMGQSLEISINRKLVRRGNLELEVEDIERLVGTIDSLAASWSGFVPSTDKPTRKLFSLKNKAQSSLSLVPLVWIVYETC